MSLPRALLATLCAVALLLTGCSKGGGGGGNAQFRIFNAFSDASAVSAFVGGTNVATGLAFQGMTTYTSVPSGSQNLVVTVAGATSPLVNITTSLGSTNYSYILYGTSQLLGTTLALDSFNDPGSGMFAVRLLNAAAGAGALDLYITAPGADLTNTAPTIGNVTYGTLTAFFAENTAVSFEIRFTQVGTKTVIFDTAPRGFAEHSGTTIVAYSKGSGSLVNVALLNEDSTGTGTILDNLLARYKIINVSQVPSPLNVFVDGSLQLSNIPYTGVSNYQQTSTGTRTFTVQAQATPGANLLTLTPNLSAATDTSIPLVGPAGALVGVVLNDNNQPPAAGSAGVRFVNTSADIASVDVYVNFSKQVSALTSNTASSYINLTAAAVSGTAYEFNFNVAGTTTPVLSMPSVLLTGPHIYTVYLAGPAASLQGVVTLDQ
ncbi:MAG TPA: DUF4397 domain-containing protein [Casimicrobiaceae bacterium]|nr:DUF4397 domain-containing protein [Casimicrobiaceae bacterium]